MTQRIYKNFNVSLSRDGDKFRISVQCELVGDEWTTFALPFSAEELGTFEWLSENIQNHLTPGAGNISTSPLTPKEFGQRLFARAFSGNVGALLQRGIKEAEERQSGLRIRLSIDHDLPALAELPWEFLYDPRQLRFFAHSDWVALVRYIPLSMPPPPALTVELPLRILAVISDPTDAPPLEVEEEWRRLQQAVAELTQQNLIVLERAERAELSALDERLRADDVHILHFIGHGFFDHERDMGGLVLEDEQRMVRETDADRFGELFADRRNLRLVFLNACEGAESGRDFFGGVAQKLVRLGVPAVIAMQYPVTDEAAITISQVFYAALATGEPVDTALTRARRQVYLDGDDREWGTPVLFSRSSDNRLITLSDEGADVGEAAIATLMASRDIYDAVLQFRNDFTAASRQIDVINAYKEMHDQLHELQFSVYAPTLRIQRRFLPDDFDHLDDLARYQSDLQAITAKLQEIDNGILIDEDDLSWVNDVEQAEARLAQAIDVANDAEERTPHLKKSVQIMKRVLVNFPSMIDGRLTTTAGDLRLDSIEQGLEKMQDRLAALEVGYTAFQPFFDKAESLTRNGSRLRDKVREHNRWQRADRDLTSIDEMLNNPDRIDDVASLWEYLTTGLLSQLTGDQSQYLVPKLQAAGQDVDKVFAEKTSDQINRGMLRQRFRTCRGLASQRFLAVDKDLLKLCKALSANKAQLESELDYMKRIANGQ